MVSLSRGPAEPGRSANGIEVLLPQVGLTTVDLTRERMENDNPYATPPTTGITPDAYLTFGYPRRRMRFWRIERLKAEMRAQPHSERESLPYLVAYVALFTLGGGFPISGFNLFDAIGLALSVAIAISGTIFIYKQNGGVDGRFFLQRYFAIGFVVALRCLVAIVAGTFVLIAVLDSLGRLSDETSVYDFLYMVVAQMLIYWRIGYHIRDLASLATHTQSVAEPARCTRVGGDAGPGATFNTPIA